MNADRFSQFWSKLNEQEKCEIVAKQAKIVNQNHKKMIKAVESEFQYTGSRTGIRGGKATTLTANAQVATTMYYKSVDDLKQMTAKL